MNLDTVLQEIQSEIIPFLDEGKVASYIPALASVEPNMFAMSITTHNKNDYHIGDHTHKFTIQSIVKVFAFAKALSIYKKDLYKRVGVEPSGNPFNSLVQLEYERGKPRNPFINAGAIVVIDTLITHYKTPQKTFEAILEFIRDVAKDDQIDYDKEVYESELQNGYRNIALANLMKSFHNIHNNVNDVVSTYFKLCSITMDTDQLANSMLFLSNHGIDPITNTTYLTESQAKRINAVMLTCGHYDASGDFAFYVGLPGKSGVGGGIVAIVPNQMSIAVFSPRLNSWGNSLAGTKALEIFTTKTRVSIF